MPNYNTQLQTHNSDLQMVLQTLQTKASGIKLPDLTNPATESEVIVGYEVINEQGVKITGTNPYEKDATDSTVAEQAGLIAQIKNAANNLPEAGDNSGNNVPETCTVKFDNESLDAMSPFICITMTVLENGSQKPYIFSDHNGVYSLTVSNVVCGSVMTIISDMYSTGNPFVEIDGSASLVVQQALYVTSAAGGEPQLANSIFIAPSIAGEECTIYLGAS